MEPTAAHKSPTPQITVRQAKQADAAAAAAAKRVAAERGLLPQLGAEKFELWAAKRCSVDCTRQRISGPGLTVVETDGEVTALGFVRPENLGDEDGGCYLGDFYVAEPGRGYGRALLEELTRQASAQGGRYMWSLVFADNADARRFFERFGWEAVGSRPNGEVEGGILIEYRLDLR